jgi:hypothetical protein
METGTPLKRLDLKLPYRARPFRLHGLMLAAILLVLGVQGLIAQQNVSAASLSGNITDTNGAAIAGATITSVNLETGYKQATTSDAAGRFRFAYLQVGNYEIKGERDGFDPRVQKITATVGQALELDLVLSLKTLSAEVNVSDVAPVVETARTQVAETILPKDVESLPLNGRNFLDLALLVPAVSRTNTASVQRFAETSAVPGTGISVAGQRNLANSFIVDGSSANDDSVELAGTYYGQDVIREFQVVTSGAVSEFGRASGGFVNIITKSGANRLRGDVYGFLRDDRFDARNPLAASKDPLTQVQYGVSLSGPVAKNRTFFFSNFEQTRRRDSNIITISQANVTAINNRLNAGGFSGPRIETGLVPGGYNTSNFFGRIDHKIDEKNSFAATYNFYDIDATNARTVGGLNAVSRGTDLNNRDHTINTQNITAFGSQTLNEFRFQYRSSRLGAPAIDQAGPAVNISGVASFGTATSSPTRRDIDLYQFSDSVSTYRSGHSIKGGVEYIYNDLDIGFPGAIQGVYTFTNLANFLSGTYSQFQQAFGADSQHQKNPNIGFFAQDEWKARRGLTLNFGLRYDLQCLPSPIKTDRDNISPRSGFAWSPDSKTVVRGSFGIFYDRIPTRATSNALQRDGSKYIVAILGPTAAGAPVFPNILAAQPSVLVTKPSITRIDPDIENNSSHQANFQVERELPYETSVSVGYLYLRGIHIILSRNVNVPRCAAAVDANLCRPDSNFGNIGRFEGSGNSEYNGLVFSLNKRQGKWGSARVSYTYSRAFDDSGNFFFSTPQDNFDRAAEWGRSDNDQRHRLTLNGTVKLPPAGNGSFLKRLYGDFQLGWIFTYASRLPFNIVTGSDRNGDTTNNDRPAGVGRNTGRGFDYASLDLRLSRTFSFSDKIRLELLVEGFNILNRSNFSVPNNTFGTGLSPLPAFGRPIAAFDPRQVQVGFRLDF